MEPSVIRYLALGDSYTIGEKVDEQERWPVQLAGRLRAAGITVEEPEIIAQTGWTTDELQAAMEAAGPQGPYDLVSLLIGVNNQYRGGDPEVYRKEFRQLLTWAIELAGDEPGRVIVLSIPDWGATPYGFSRKRERIAAEIDQFNAINREETGRAGARYVDVTGESRRAPDDRTLVARDGLHPSGEAYGAWVELAWPEVLATLDIEAR
jgi:lysophospholipase L1-like esterase